MLGDARHWHARRGRDARGGLHFLGGLARDARQVRGEGHRSLAEGQQVEFSVTQGQKGLQAEDVAGL